MAEAIRFSDSFEEGPDGEAAEAAFWADGAAEVPTIDLTYPGAAGQGQPARLYRGSAEVAPVLLYIHGGGWSGGSIDLHERACRGPGGRIGLACAVGVLPAGAGHPYPAGLDDCRAALCWLREQAAPLELDTSAIAVGGASAGANLAAACALAEPPGTFAGLILYLRRAGRRSRHRQLPPRRGWARPDARPYAELFEMYDPESRRHRTR